MIKNRITSIDSLKVLLYFFIICIHITSWKYKMLVLPVARIAVPIFFMISGFLIDIKNVNVLRKHAVKVLYSFFIVVLIHIILFFSTNYIIYHRGFYDSLLVSPLNGQRLLSTQGIFNFIFFNEVTLMPHLWYLSTYIYALFALSFLTKIKTQNLFYLSCLMILLANAISISWPELDSFYYRNFIFLGIPYIVIGNYIRHTDYERIKNPHLLILVFIFVTITYCESFTLNSTHSSILLSILIFILTVKNSNANIFPQLSKFISINGLHIYSYHYIVIVGIGILMSKLEHFKWVYTMNSHLKPFIIYFITIYLIYIYRIFFSNRLNKFKSDIKKHY